MKRKRQGEKGKKNEEREGKEERHAEEKRKETILEKRLMRRMKAVREVRCRGREKQE